MNLPTPPYLKLAELLVFTLFAAALLQQVFDWDIWYHLSIGREIASSFSIPAHEFLVYPNANQPGEYHEWGFGLLFYSVHQLAGFWGMSLLNAAIATSTLWLLFRAVDKNPWSSPVNLLVLLAVLMWLQSRFIYRPEMILYLALAAELFLLERFYTEKHWKWLAPIPIIGLILSQAHPSVILMLILLGGYTVQLAVDFRTQSSLVIKYSGWFFLCGIFTIILALLNPYGLEQLLLPLSFSQQEKLTMDIFEFKPSLDSVDKWSFITLVACALTALLSQQNKRVVDWLLFLLFAYLALRYVRNIAVFALVMYIPMARGFSRILQLAGNSLAQTRPARVNPAYQNSAWGVTVAAFAFVLISAVNGQTWGAGPLAGQYPERSVRVIKEVKPPGHILNSYEMGGYLGWMLKGQYPVFIDGRHYRMNRTMAAYRSIRNTRAGWKNALNAYDVNTIIFPPKLIAGKLLPLLAALADDPEWVLAVAENREMLFFRDEVVTGLPATYRLEKQQIWPMIIDEAMWTLEVFPDQHLAYVTLADALVQTGDREQAIEALRDYMTLEPKDEAIARRLADLESGK